MSLNEFGYDNAAPNPPWIFRDQQNKCQECGAVYVGSLMSACPACPTNDTKHFSTTTKKE